MKTQHLYSLLWEYRERWRVPIESGEPESEGFAYVEGTVEGRLSGHSGASTTVGSAPTAAFWPTSKA